MLFDKKISPVPVDRTDVFEDTIRRISDKMPLSHRGGGIVGPPVKSNNHYNTCKT